MPNPIGLAAGAFGGVVLLVVVLAAGSGVVEAAPPAGGCAVTPGAPAPGGDGGGGGPQQTAELNAAQMGIAKTIIGVGKGMNIGERGTAIALATAMQESTLDPHATSPGGRSLGLFQQQGEYYAGVDRADPVDTSRAFYDMLLKRVPNYADPALPIADAAQTVQASGAGAHWYARWADWAIALAGQLYAGAAAPPPGGASPVVCAPGGSSGPVAVQRQGTTLIIGAAKFPFPNEQTATAAQAALSWQGTPYAWGGGDANGPTKGIRDGGVADAHGDYNKIGFDCAGLTQYAFAQAGITVTRPSWTQLTNATTTAPAGARKPGDLLFWGRHHVALYLGRDGTGRDKMVEAPQSGDVVKISDVRTGGDFQSTVARPAP